MPIPIKLWFELIEEDLKEMSDRNFQRKQWGPEGPWYASFNEFVASFYEDADFEGFIEKIQQYAPSSTFLLAAIKLNRDFNRFLDSTTVDERYDDYERLIETPEWRKLSDDAGRLLGLLKHEKDNLISMIKD